jgi:hypothetical protein
MTSRRFPAPWRADKIPGGYVIRDAANARWKVARRRPSEAAAAM